MNKNITKLLFSAALLLCCMTAWADPQQVNGFYQLQTKEDLVWFADHVNSGNASTNAMLMADIVVNSGVLNDDGTLNGTPQIIWTPIGGFNGNGKDHSGEFNGNGHTISGLYFNNGVMKNVGLFGKTASGAHIHDLGVSDSYFYGQDHVGGICGDFANGLIENCWSEVAVYVTSGDGGGLTGSVFTNAVLKDSYSICNVSGNGSRGLVCGALTGTIENCYAKSINSTGTTNAIGWTDPNGNPTATNVEVKSASAFASGEVCYMLNYSVTDGTQKWYQTLDTDNFPVLNNSHGTVYRGYDGDVLTYSNSLQSLSSIDNVAYIDANGEPQTHDNVSIIRNASEKVTWSAGWYVVQGADITLAKGAVCNGEVHLILADGAKLTATGEKKHAGITVSGDGKSLTIYGQTAQSGQLIANGGKFGAGIGGGEDGNGSNITINGGIVIANGEYDGASIGGGYHGSGSNITINGGTVTANGGHHGAGIGGGYNGSGSNITINGGTITATGGDTAAGIGGGEEGSGSNITINGGTVTANGGQNAAGIGGGEEGSGSNIKVATAFTVYADNTTPPTNEILHTDNDIASYIAALRYVIVKDEMTNVKNEAIAAINAAIIGVTNADIIAIATYAIDAINAAANPHEIEIIKAQALAAIASAKAIYNSALGEMGVPCDDCPAVDVTKGTTTIRLYSPEKVEFRKME
ncbi:MAG: carbohydrate-binding domain-containing protein [Bacteroidales bacterium]|nr:carbohydrate-binding domain-containing protein [Bacteroidales bacterium]